MTDIPTENPPQKAFTVKELLMLLQDLMSKPEGNDSRITLDTPIACFNDAEGNQLHWLMGFSIEQVNYTVDQYPFSLMESDHREKPTDTPTTVLCLFPAD